VLKAMNTQDNQHFWASNKPSTEERQRFDAELSLHTNKGAKKSERTKVSYDIFVEQGTAAAETKRKLKVVKKNRSGNSKRKVTFADEQGQPNKKQTTMPCSYCTKFNEAMERNARTKENYIKLYGASAAQPRKGAHKTSECRHGPLGYQFQRETAGWKPWHELSTEDKDKNIKEQQARRAARKKKNKAKQGAQ
jgi:hypothetical protein